jgi:hypothetical protein
MSVAGNVSDYIGSSACNLGASEHKGVRGGLK